MLDFWLTVAVGLLALWLRVYIHYLGQWVYLKAIGAAVYGFEPLLERCVLKYVASTLAPVKEIGVVIMGPAACCLAMCFFMWAAALSGAFDLWNSTAHGATVESGSGEDTVAPGDDAVVNGLLGQNAKRPCFTSPGGTLAPAGPVVTHLVSSNPSWGTGVRHVDPSGRQVAPG